jgi:hypothetical protein
MRNKTSPFQFALMFVVILALAAFPGSANADHSWGNYHWARTANPFTLKVGDNVSSAWDAYLDEAIADWNPSTVLDLTKVAGGARSKNCRPTSGRIEVCNARYGNNGWLGIAQIWITGSVHITQATTKVNDTYFETPTYNTPAWRRLVMCQEIAHDFGLDHQDEGFGPPNLGTCMDYTNDPDGGGAYGPSNEHPNSHDFQQLVTIYSHLDSFNSYDTSSAIPPGFANADVHAVENWGAKVRESANGRSAIYIRDFGNDFKIITHVFWAE